MANPSDQQPNLLSSIAPLNRLYRVQLLSLPVRVVDDYQEIDQLYDEAVRSSATSVTTATKIPTTKATSRNSRSYLTAWSPPELDDAEDAAMEKADLKVEEADLKVEEADLKVAEENEDIEEDNDATIEGNDDDTLDPDSIPLPDISLTDPPASSDRLAADDAAPSSKVIAARCGVDCSD
ncbi:hypothetical protein TI39_contig4218g00006 [Zymoseptoria brevis]|uniref:Uncharacterized protein n=1 Tax=Zymoseptoria brevis TaxID=1047168 RepID=A0A0F4GD37_9PEZI|nr:hypothetical protein TI39_contig4218g00006 [Zymoseptoria brevis]